MNLLPLSTHRFAVMTLFGLNGFLYSSWASRVPQIQEQYGIDDSSMGFVLISASTGAFLAMPFSAWINERLGIKRVALISAVIYIITVSLIPQFSTPAILFVIYGFMGVGFGLMDVAMNAQGVEIERRAGRSMIASFHAGFSGAMIAGALTSSLMIWLGLQLNYHLTLTSFLALIMLVYSIPRLLPDEAMAPDKADEPSPLFRFPTKATWLLGMIGFCSIMSESSISDWTAKYMLEVAGSSSVMAPWSLAAFAIMMTIGRIRGDKLRDKLGDRKILSWGTLLAFCGLGISLLYPNPYSTIIGAGLVGTGLSVAVPILFSLAGNLKGISSSAALSMVTSVSYLGLFLGPAVIGFLAEHYGLRAGYSFILGALGIMVVLVNRLQRPAEKH